VTPFRTSLALGILATGLLGGLRGFAQQDLPEAQLPMLELQVRLDRAGFSPGEIDARSGPNTDRAWTAFAASRGLPPTTADVASKLEAIRAGDRAEPLISYTLTDADVAGPFGPAVPTDLMKQSELPALRFTSVAEALGEKFHCTPALLTALNPGTSFRAGDALHVPNLASPAGAPPSATTVVVSRSGSTLTVKDETGDVIFHAPVTSGSEHDPLPIGRWTVTAVTKNPVFNYNPDLFWDANPGHAKAKIPAGPNNPVGVVWIDLNKEHYGIHGTPEPGRIGHSSSHGCVRLTNWDAARLAAMVQKGTTVIFEP